jgi:hypothetical protein
VPSPHSSSSVPNLCSKTSGGNYAPIQLRS